MEHYKTPKWNQFPDLALYMDQVITYLDSHLLKQSGETILTPAMVNNYVKQGVIERPNKKKYEKDQLSQLFEIAILKQVLPISEIASLIESLGNTAEERYTIFQTELDKQLKDVVIHEDSNSKALELLLDAYVSIFRAKQILKKNEKE